MKTPLLCLFLILALLPSSFAQDCDCPQRFQYVKEKIANNYAGFADKTGGAKLAAYHQLTRKTEAKLQSIKKPNYCFAAIAEWLDFFQDAHIQLYPGKGSENDSTNLALAIKETEVINISKARLAQLRSEKGMEGIYVLYDSSYTVALIKDKNEFRDYAAVIVRSSSPYWQPGQVKFELKQYKDQEYTALTYARDHAPHTTRYKYDGESLGDGEWIKTNAVKAGTLITAETGAVAARKLTDSTFYVKISSFDPAYARSIDSVFSSNAILLAHTPNLIIDLRDNGGGSDFCYAPIIPLIYTGPIIEDGVTAYATPDNIYGWTALLDNPDIPNDKKDELRAVIDSMKKHIGGFVTITPDDTTKMDKVAPYPRKVVILTNHGCGSSTEQLLLAARQSKKVTLMGQPSYGVLDYSNMRQGRAACSNIGLFYATSRSKRIERGRGIDNIGVKPDISLPTGSDYIKEALRYLEHR